MANRIVSNLPATLFDNLDEEGMEYFKEAFDFYEVEYEITPLEETCEVCGYPSRQVIVLGRIVEYYGQRNGFLQLAKKYNFETIEINRIKHKNTSLCIQSLKNEMMIDAPRNTFKIFIFASPALN